MIITKLKTEKRKKWEWREEGFCPRGRWFWAEHCDIEYRFRTVCGREDCPICGRPHSWAHKRRYKRGLKHIWEMIKSGYVGYLVVTCPEEQRMEWVKKEELRKKTKYIKRMLQREFGKEIKGVMGWHWAGDRGGKWYPHLNVLFTMGYITKLERIKELIEKRLKIRVVYYQYSNKMGKVFFWV